MSNPAMSKEQAESLVTQLQQAHRLTVGFYRRILPTLDMVANQLGFEFWYWEPLFNERPPQGKTRPSSKWAWDYVPLYASSHVYKKTNGEKCTGPKDFGIKFNLFIEDSFDPDKRGDNGQPDPIKMQKGEAVLRAYLYRPNTEVQDSFENLWDEEGEREAGIGSWESLSPNWDGIAFEWLLAEVIRDIQPLIAELQKAQGA